MSDFTVYSSTSCGPCRIVQAMIKARGFPLEVKKLGQDFTPDELFELTGKRTVPQVFIDGKYVGGLAEVREWFKRH